MMEVKGEANIVVKILADSISEAGIRLVTYELTYPRLILAELNTHCMLSKNSASSRAIPFKKMSEQLVGRPVRFGEANPGMQDKGEDFDAKLMCYADGSGYPLSAQDAWESAREDALMWSKRFYKAGYHKQVYNRLTEPFQMMKTVLSGTELENFFWLRNHGAADPSLQELARCMYEAREQSVPQVLKAGEWHLPYVRTEFEDGKQVFFIEQEVEGWGEAVYYITLEQAIKVSCARTAAVSFRNEDYGLEKCMEVYDRLINSDRVHASATQHCATPMQPQSSDYTHSEAYTTDVNNPVNTSSWEQGVSHADRNGQLWSAQYKGWIMFRKTIPNENYTGE